MLMDLAFYAPWVSAASTSCCTRSRHRLGWGLASHVAPSICRRVSPTRLSPLFSAWSRKLNS